MRVLYLSEWYPHRYDAMFGLFVRKHAQAVVRQGVDVTVLYLHHDEHIRKEELVEQMTDGVREIYVYYPHTLGYLKAFRHGYQYIKRTQGRPDLCQLNVITKNGLLPLYLWKRFHIPYIIVEHWSGYLPQNRKQSLGLPHLWMSRILTRNARVVLPVSQSLMDAMKQCGLTCSQWQLIPNVVDDFFYTTLHHTPNTTHRTPDTKQIIHISCFDEKAKNIKGLLRVIQQLTNVRKDFLLTLIGTGKDYDFVRKYANSLDINPFISFTEEQTPQQVCQWIKQSDFLVLFSNFETYGIVLSEAAAVGIPSIETTTCGLQIPPSCGIIIPPQDEKELFAQMNYLLDHYQDYDTDTIRQYGQQFTFEAVGKKLLSLYEQILCS